jgi:Skp family chaperone for outer membrane proteins
MIFTMKRIALLLVLVIGLAATSAARSQQPTNTPAANAPTPVSDTVSLKPSPELQKALEDLAAAVQALAQKIASDPQIKAAAMQVASGAVTTAQQVVAEQSVAIQEALKTAAERISAAQTNPHQRSRKQ